jgi:hypothetical protein
VLRQRQRGEYVKRERVQRSLVPDAVRIEMMKTE